MAKNHYFDVKSRDIGKCRHKVRCQMSNSYDSRVRMYYLLFDSGVHTWQGKLCAHKLDITLYHCFQRQEACFSHSGMVMTFCTYQKVLEGQVPHLLLVALAGGLLRQGPGRAGPLLMGLLDSPVLPLALHEAR